jgi:hypothetical protein
MRDALLQNPSCLKWYAHGKAIARNVAQGLAYLHKHDMVRPSASRKWGQGCLILGKTRGSIGEKNRSWNRLYYNTSLDRVLGRS